MIRETMRALAVLLTVSMALPAHADEPKPTPIVALKPLPGDVDVAKCCEDGCIKLVVLGGVFSTILGFTLGAYLARNRNRRR